MTQPNIAIVDYGLGNLYSVQRACEHVGLPARITDDPRDVDQADGIILPGVGAFGDAMSTLRQRGLVEPLRAAVAADRPLLGVCLGIQLLMSESQEFGHHEGLGIVEGVVARLESPRDGARILKVPEVGWNRVLPHSSWQGTPLQATRDGEHMYFVHSYVVQPSDPGVILSTTRYGHIEFCSSLRRGSLFACQFHPERSGPAGLEIYRQWAALVRARGARIR